MSPEKSIAGKTIKQPAKSVPRSIVVKFLQDAGIDANQVSHVAMTPCQITALLTDSTCQVVQIIDMR